MLASLLLATFLPALGCTASADAAAEETRSGAAAGPVEISSFSKATYTALVADGAGALHAVWLDQDPETLRQAIYHRASSDGGRTWGRPSSLSGGQPDGYTGIPSAVADAAGRVYVVWKVVDRGTSMAQEELRSTPAYGTLVYRALENGRWSPVRSIGAERGVVAWFAAADLRGRAHVVWSENPDGGGMMSTTADAGTVRQAQLDGSTPRGGQVINAPSRSGKLGYWTLSGWIGADGVAHWVAVRGSEAERRSVLVHSGDGRERTLPYDAAAAGARTPPQLVLTGDEERVIYYEGGARPRVMDRSLDADRAPVAIATGADAETIQDFQISNVGRQLVATIQATGNDGNRLADVYVATLRNYVWTKPVRITDNANATRQQGVTDTRGRSLGTVQVMSAIHASVVPDRTGALHVLLTNRETSRHVDTRAGGMSGASARSRAWFMTVPGVLGVAAEGGQRPLQPTQREPEPAPVSRRADATVAPRAAAAEQLFARYDVTEDGWLSGTELQACQCRAADSNRDGEVTRAEFVAAVSSGRGNAAPATANSSRTDLTREAERLFKQYDITEGGWLSGTELNACACRGDDANGDGEVTKAEFVAGFVRRGGASPAPARSDRTNPAPAADERREAPRAGGGAGLPTGKYNCYAYGTARPMPWEPGFGGAAEAPRSTTQYIMNLTIEAGGNYQYLNRGRGTYALAPGGMIDWRSGPMAGSGIKAAFSRRSDGRPVIYLSLEGTRAHCVGPQ